MPDEPGGPLPHIEVRGSAKPEPYTYPHKVRGSAFPLPPRERIRHGNRLLETMARVRDAADELRDRRTAVGIAEDRSIYLEFESDAGFELMLKSLDRIREGIELVAVRERGDVMLATVFVADGKLPKLEQLILAYRDEDDPRWGKAKNRRLVESIAQIRQAAVESFCTDDESLLPDFRQEIWWEVWLRVGANRDEIETAFRAYAAKVGVQVQDRRICFADRTVLLGFGTPEQLSQLVELLDCVAELRLAKERPEFFVGLTPREQADWIKDLLERLELPGEEKPAICILDTGVNNGHPLLRSSLADEDLLTCDPTWGIADQHSHGTEMAGLCLFGDLTEPLAHGSPVRLDHCLESVKILPPPGFPPNERELYGAITEEAIGRVEAQEARRHRVFCMAVATPDFRNRGEPSSWSAAVDATTCGVQDDRPRLMLLCAGNVSRGDWRYYPDHNDVDQVHDPGQAWNALTVGAMTEKVVFDDQTFPNWTPVARPGGLSPSSTTSVTWPTTWPNKPDFVFEGGNGIREPGTGFVDTDDSLLLLTTHWRPGERLLATSGDTSAATAQAAKMAATILARYPSFWPETVRGLLVHSCEWTPEMLSSTEGPSPAARARLLLRRFGYGVPNLERASWSASNSLTLVAQDSLLPFEKRKSTVATRDMNLHELPWPREELMNLGAEQVELRVTLSYFIEPNPARRGWKYRHLYRSHALRFAIRAPAEGLDEFRARVSKDAQDEEQHANTPRDPGWSVGPQERNRGSIHSDVWRGNASDLALRSILAVYPVGGWWKERPHLERWRRRARYSLIVTIKTPEMDVDIYTPVANLVGIEIPT